MSLPLAEDFLALHRPGSPLVVPNPWDAGSAWVLAMLGFQALATTSSGFAATLARLDGSVTRDEALAHAAHLVAAVDLPVTADLANGFADEPAAVAVTVTAAAGLGLAGCSIEDNGSHGIYDAELAADRVAAAVEAAAGRLILTARADNFCTHLHPTQRWRGRPRAGGSQATRWHLATSARPTRVRLTRPLIEHNDRFATGFQLIH